MAIDKTAVVTRNPRVEYRTLDGEGGVLLHLDTANYHGVNQVGELVWELLDGRTFGAVLAQLALRLESLPDTFAEEISDFVEQLAVRDLVRVQDSVG